MKNNKRVTIHTDGACSGNPGPGSYAACLEMFEGRKSVRKWSVSDREVGQTTNQRMELKAVLEGLKAIPSEFTGSILIVSDSTYVVNGGSSWLHKWKVEGLHKRPNADLWKAIDAAMRGRSIAWQWVKAHGSDLGNCEAHDLAALTLRAA